MTNVQSVSPIEERERQGQEMERQACKCALCGMEMEEEEEEDLGEQARHNASLNTNPGGVEPSFCAAAHSSAAQ